MVNKLLLKYIYNVGNTAVAEWLSSWLAEQEDRGSIPGLATWTFRDLLSPASKSRYDWKIAKSSLILKTTNQPTNQPNIYNCTILKETCLVFITVSYPFSCIFTGFHWNLTNTNNLSYFVIILPSHCNFFTIINMAKDHWWGFGTTN